MFRNQRKRLLTIGAVVALCIVALWPSVGPRGDLVWPLHLGLDLQGGMHLAVEVADPDGTLTPEAEADAIDRTLTIIRNRINEFGVREPTIQKVGDERIIVELAGIRDPERAKQIVERSAFLEFKVVRDGEEFRELLPRLDRAVVQAVGAENLEAPDVAPETDITDILAGEGTDTVDSEPGGGDTAAADGADTVGADGGAAGDEADGRDGDAAPAGGADGEALRPLTRLLLESGIPGMFLVAEQDVETVQEYVALEGVQELLPRGVELVWGGEPVVRGGASYRELYVLEQDPLITGEYLADAGPATRDPTFNQPIVPFEMTRQGARIFERGTARHVGDYMAIVLDGRVQSAPVIRQVLSRRAQIELGAGASLQEAQDLALVLRAGALPQPIRIVEERTVGPSLGEDSIRGGKIAFSVGLALVVLLIVGYYRLSGLLAVGGLCIYVLVLLGALAGFQADLTLPGIAGLILSVGMAVDANVLIFEHIREELDAGKTPRTAVDQGFQGAMSAIVDSNLTTLLTAAFLYQFGTGPIRGFAVTLCIGIIASFFSAVFVTRTFYLMYLDSRSPSEPISI